MAKRKFFRRRKRGKDKTQDRRLKKLENLVGNPEFKSHTVSDPDIVSGNGVSIQDTNTMIINALTEIATGQSGGSRIGDKIQVKHLEVRLSVWFKESQYAQFVRFVCFVDRGYNENLAINPTGADILAVYNTTNGSLYNMTSVLNPDSFNMRYDTKKSNMAKNYKLLFDTTITPASITPNGGVASTGVASAPHYTRIIRKRLNNMVYFNASNDYAGRIWLAVFPGNNTTATNNPYYNWHAQLAYIDN